MNTGAFTGKSFIVTGAGSGMGLAIAHYLCSQGGMVSGVGRSHDKLDNARRLICVDKEVFFPLPADITSPEACKAIVHDTMTKWNRIDGVIHAAGTFVFGSALELKEDEWDLAFDSNVKSAWLLSRAVLKVMIQAKSGCIVNISSVLGSTLVPNCCAYASSKAALIQLTKSIALDFGPLGVRCNCICPGLTETPMTKNVFEDKELVKELTLQYPMGRLGKPEDMLSAVHFLLSDQSLWVNGAVITVDGGYSLSSEVNKS